jgi:alpha-D-ribose 1-methylphosphonate 5-triphosphate synthase subunit PhnH
LDSRDIDSSIAAILFETLPVSVILLEFADTIVWLSRNLHDTVIENELSYKCLNQFCNLN